MSYKETMELIRSLLEAAEKCDDAGQPEKANIWFRLFASAWSAHFQEPVGITPIEGYSDWQNRYVKLRNRLRILDDPPAVG